jgi:glutamate-1-semialdehyde 2,1-aminomutase
VTIAENISGGGVDAFRSATPRSRNLWERAREVLPQGVSGQAKFFNPYPIFVASARGGRVVDVDGRSYVDLLMGAGPMLLGHGHPRVVEAIRRQVSEMTNPMMPNPLSVEYAERLRGCMPYLERLRFTNTGSEATRSAVRVARAVTGRLKIAKFEGNFHGSDDVFLVSTHSTEVRGAADRPEPVLDYAGLSPRLLDEVVVLPYNNAAAAASLISEHGPELAAVIMEPVAFSSGGAIPARREFAEAVRRATIDQGVLLVFDEVLSAFRLGLAGAPAYLGVTPDLATIGKAVGGGLPLAAFGGRADVMEAALGPDAGPHRIFQSGTFTENPVSIAAGLATLDVLETEPALERANRAGEALRCGLRRVVEEAGVHAAVTGVGSIAQIHFGANSVTDRRDVLTADVARAQDFMLGLVAKGVLWPPVHPAVTSAAHGEGEIDAVLSAARAVLGVEAAADMEGPAAEGHGRSGESNH